MHEEDDRPLSQGHVVDLDTVAIGPVVLDGLVGDVPLIVEK